MNKQMMVAQEMVPCESSLTPNRSEGMAGRQADGQRAELIRQTLEATGISPGELRYITAEAVSAGKVEANLRKKGNGLVLPHRLCQALKRYLRAEGILSGPVFATTDGRAMDRAEIWRETRARREQNRNRKNGAFRSVYEN